MVKVDKAVQCAELGVENNCFQDFGDRILKSSDNLYSVSTTIDLCTSHCFGKNHLCAGLEAGVECFCGNEIHQKCVRLPSEYNVPCSGNSLQMCGAAWRMNIYENAIHFAGKSYTIHHLYKINVHVKVVSF